jgi:hypothetical protein
MLISAFFRGVLQTVHDQRPAELARARSIRWLLNYDFQRESVVGWMLEFEPLEPIDSSSEQSPSSSGQEIRDALTEPLELKAKLDGDGWTAELRPAYESIEPDPLPRPWRWIWDDEHGWVGAKDCQYKIWFRHDVCLSSIGEFPVPYAGRDHRKVSDAVHAAAMERKNKEKP